MEVITFRCSACKKVLKIGADKAGRKAKCKCGAEVVVPAASEGAEPPAPPPLPPPPPPKIDDEDDDTGAYGLIGDFSAPTAGPEDKKKKRDEDEDEEGEGEKKEAKPKKQRARFKVTKARSLVEPEKWVKVCTGLQIVTVGFWICFAGLALREVPVVVGLFHPAEYGPARLRWEDPKLYATLTKTPEADAVITKPEFLYSLVTGTDGLALGLWFVRIPAILLVLGSLTLLVGYAVCLPVPNRFGTRGQLLTLIALAALNAIFTVVFRVLPAFGVMNYTLIPIAVPELALVNANTERELALSVLLSDSPMLDYLLAFVVLGTFTLEPTVLAIFLRGVALTMRNLDLQGTAEGMISLSLGTAFTLLCYVILMITGTSDVLGIVLKLLYLLGLGFLLGQFLWYPFAIAKFPPEIRKELGSEADWGGDEKKPRRPARDEDEDDEEEEEEEDE